MLHSHGQAANILIARASVDMDVCENSPDSAMQGMTTRACCFVASERSRVNMVKSHANACGAAPEHLQTTARVTNVTYSIYLLCTSYGTSNTYTRENKIPALPV